MFQISDSNWRILDRVKQLQEIEDGAFYGMRLLRTISIKQAPKLKKIQDAVFNCHLPSLKIVRIIQSGLESIPNLQFIETKSIIYMVDLDSNKINRLSTGSVKMKTEMLNLDFNLITKIEKKAFFGSEIAKLSLKGNAQLHSIDEQAFLGLKNIRSLDLSETRISYLPTKGLEELEILRLSDVYPLKVFPSVYHFKYIKEAHLTYPYHCCAFKFPATHDPEEFSKYVAFKENIQKMYCNQNPSTTTPMSITEKSKDNTELRKRQGLFVRKQQWIDLVSETDSANSQTESSLELANFWGKHHKRHPKEHIYTTTSTGERIRSKKAMSNKVKKVFRRRAEWGGVPKPQNTIFYQDYWLNMSDSEDFFGNHLPPKGRKPNIHKNLPDNPFEGVFHGTTVAVISEVELEAFCGQLSKNYRDVECFPSPDAFNPCEDVMGNMLLRVVVWIVVVTSVMGNVAVMVVLMSTGACNSVSKFLMCNLAFADFCMGCYLLMIAAMDLHSIGTYFNYAIDWQHGYGCQVAGFLTVFATELSIYTLTVISVERWYAITYAINLNKRLKLRRAANIMAVGWIFALTMAFLPLINVNGFSRTSICLPMKNQHVGDVVYLMILLVTNSLAFVFIFFCYGNMYMSVIRHQSRATANDMAVAKRMAMLVMTDFLCWAPVAFFAATAVSGYPLIDVTNSKILLVFFYPLNSCANPFLYAIFTTQYRRDFLSLLNRCDCCRRWTRKKKDRYSTCNVPPLQFSDGSRHWHQNNSCSSQMSTDNSMKVLRPSDLSSQQDVFSTSGWEDQDVEDVINLWSNVFPPCESSSSEDSGQCCKNYSSSSHSTVTYKGSPHPVKHRFVHMEMPTIVSPETPMFHTTRM
ncbi:thyrotropin receptor [Trichonephila clavata]|uniref:Thyrotropin receptor n=1 Tax=Trichonephila clavata TaxID=2740835 RepID=A0A8X6FDQ5_TRICU|nr:thyrotropin receptor [Trichonephila clavata]